MQASLLSIIARLPLALAFAAALTSSGDALAYCRTSICDGGHRAGARCEPAQPTDCGIPLGWVQPCIGFSLHEGASQHIGLEPARALMLDAFGAWDDAACPAGGEPSIEVHDLGPVTCDEKEYNQHGGNANVVVFRDDAWPYAGAGNTLALTTVTFNLADGAIYDADLEVNGTVPLTTTDDDVEYDLASIVTHEAGHFLGLSHSPEPGSTMIVEYAPGDVSLRTLAPDDLAAICTTYPPGPVAEEDCDPTPRHGMSSICDPPVPEPEGCTCSLAGGPPHDRAGRTGTARYFDASAVVAFALGMASIVRRARKSA